MLAGITDSSVELHCEKLAANLDLAVVHISAKVCAVFYCVCVANVQIQFISEITECVILVVVSFQNLSNSKMEKYRLIIMCGVMLGMHQYFTTSMMKNF